MRTKLHHLLEERARSHNHDAPALTFRETTLSYADLWRQVLSVAAGLVELGIEREERIGVFIDKRIETVVTVFASSAAGAAFVPVNPVLRPRQVAHILADCDVSVLVTSTERLALLTEQLADCPALRTVVVIDSDDVPPRDAPNRPYSVETWSTLVDADTEVATSGSQVDLDMAAIFYTSGSTGQPKGVVLSHRNLIVGAESVSQYLTNSSDDVILAVLPISFDAGFSQLTTAFSAGAHVVLMNYLLPADVARLCGRHGVTGLTCVPPLWNKIAGVEWPSETASTLRYFANTGGHLPKPTLDRLRELFPAAEPFLMYGLTEAFRSTFLDPNEIDRRPGSMGKAIPNAEVLVVRPDGSPCDPGEEGELVHRGALVALGYWNDPERTAVRFRPAPGREAPWRSPELAVWSGDQVIADEDGFLFFIGRRDEMIKTSGYRVSPTEVEEVAYATGLVGEVAALGIPDADLGQRIVLVASPPVEGGIDESDLLAALRDELPSYMVPSIVTRTELPRSANGKIDRAAIAKELSG